MPLSEKPSARTARNPLPPKLATLVREFWWFALVGLALYLLLILYTYSKADPGWSRSVGTTAIENAGGRVGAWLADVMLYAFGLSAYWWVVACAVLVAWGFRRIENVPEADQRSYLVAAIGFAVVLVASAGIPNERAPLGVRVMQAGKDYLADKPGVTSLPQLSEIRRVQAQTRRIYSILYGRLESPAVQRAIELVDAGAIGKVLQTMGTGPHRIGRIAQTGSGRRRSSAA